MRMDVSGSIQTIAGLLAILLTAWFSAGHAWWVHVIASFIYFMGWIFLLSGLKELNEVRKDKKARRKKDA